MPGSSSWMPCAPQGVKGLDDDDSLLVNEIYYGLCGCTVDYNSTWEA